MKAFSVKQIQALDKLAIEKFSMPSIILMENAGRCVAEEILKSFRKKNQVSVCIVCGVGNNAGDGFVTARHLINSGVKVRIFIIGSAKNLKSDAAINYKILKNIKYSIQEITGVNKNFVREVKKAEIVVDAIFGVGLNREITGLFKEVVAVINTYAKKVIAVDIPSGLDGTTGNIYGVCIHADKTVTFSFIKKGFLKNFGPKVTGEVVVADIGIPKILQNKIKNER